MAAGDVLQQLNPTGAVQVRFFVSGSFSPAVANTNMTIGTPTDVALTLAGVATLAARQSAKVNFGTKFALGFSVWGVVDFTGETPASGTIDYYWSPTASATAATGNIAGGAGADADVPDASTLGSITLAEILLLYDYIGSFAVHDGASVQGPALVNPRWFPSSQRGQLVVVNNSLDAFEDDDVEMCQYFNSLVPNVAQ